MATYPHLIGNPGTQVNPESVHVEKVILGAMMVDPVAITDSTMFLTADDFALDSHRKIYRAILHLVETGFGVDFLTVSEALSQRKEFDSVGGRDYVAELTEKLPRKLSIEPYVQIVRDKSLLRQLMSVCDVGLMQAADQASEALVVLNDVSQRLIEISDRAITRGFADIPAIVKGSFGSIDALYEQGRDVTGLATHYIDFDKMTSGLQHSELIIIAARPSMGKTAWAINIAENAAVHGGKVVAVFSLEMSKESLLRRMLASQARVNSKAIQTGMLMKEDRSKLVHGLERLMESKMFIDDTPGITLAEMRAKARRLQQQQGSLDLIVIDYLQLMTGSAGG